ncbi:UNVERIFIED_CONTAM: hypothetical protein GTU68_028457 [Idotea baltica]|nr:hypothetical protein [Idotea baltica]
MDAFYASVEQRDHPELRGKPIAVGGGEHRGVTTTASYEARTFGVRSAMPGYKAKQLCPQLIFVKPRFDVYKHVSMQIRSIFKEYTSIIEPLSLDEAFLDVTNNNKGILYGMEVAQEIMERVQTETELTCSAGVSYCKFLAKVASGYKKPNGLTVIRPKHAKVFLDQLPVKDFFGVGKVTAAKMARMNIHCGADLKTYTKIQMAQHFGKSGLFYYDIVRGKDDRPVQADRVRKSLGVERTLDYDAERIEDIMPILINIVDTFYTRLLKANNFGRTLTLKIKTSDFKSLTRSISKEYFISDKNEIRQLSSQLLDQNQSAFDKIRLIGLTASNLQKEQEDRFDPQLTFDWKGSGLS